MTIVLACGLKREARIIAAPGRDIVPVIGGGDSARLEAELEERARAGVSIILSSGIAGALDPVLTTGAVIIDGDVDPVKKLRNLIPDAIVGSVIGQDSICATAAAKSALGKQSGAVAVDMESHVARRVAQRHRLPFVAIRIISDTAETDLPPATLVGMRPDGGMALGAVLLSLARHPAQLPALLRAGRDAGQAFSALGRAHDALARIWPGLADLR